MITPVKLWADIYRPSNLDTYIFQDEKQRKAFSRMVKDHDLPNLIFSGTPGSGKTTLAKILINSVGIDKDVDLLELNGSDDNSVDTIREIVKSFAYSFSMSGFKIVFIDECLDENTLVVVLRKGVISEIKISDVDAKSDLVKSYNIIKDRIEWSTFSLFDKNIRDVLEIEFENGDTVICTPDHKWFVKDSNNNIIVVNADELYKYMYVLSPA